MFKMIEGGIIEDELISILLFILVVGGISLYAYLQSKKLKQIVQMVTLWEVTV